MAGMNVVEMIKWSNIISAIMLILVGVTQIISLSAILSSFSFNFFMCLFLPFFLILFGLLIFAMGQKMEFVQTKFKFLTILLGRGMFNIYLASIAVYQLADGTSQIIGFVLGGLLFITGIIYIILHFFGNKEELSSYREQLA